MKKMSTGFLYAAIAAVLILLSKKAGGNGNGNTGNGGNGNGGGGTGGGTSPFSIQYVADQLPKIGNGWPSRSLSGITDITIHHTAGNRTDTATSIANFHIGRTDGGQWLGIAYAFIVYPDGRILQCLPLTAKSWHNGYNNTKAVPIAMPGNYENYAPTQTQYDAMIWLCSQIRNQATNIFYLQGHKEYLGATACPGRFTDMNYLRSATGLRTRSARPAALGPGRNLEPADN